MILLTCDELAFLMVHSAAVELYVENTKNCPVFDAARALELFKQERPDMSHITTILERNVYPVDGGFGVIDLTVDDEDIEMSSTRDASDAEMESYDADSEPSDDSGDSDSSSECSSCESCNSSVCEVENNDYDEDVFGCEENGSISFSYSPRYC